MRTNGGNVVLLHKIMPGIADGSFGLEVAAVAQVPPPVIARAREILSVLTAQERAHQKVPEEAIHLSPEVTKRRHSRTNDCC